MKTVTRTTAAGGTIIEYYNEQGQRVRVIHRAGNAYSGKIAAKES